MASEITMKELTTTLSASLNMLKGFCCDGKLCNAWMKVNENVIAFRFSDTHRNIYIALDEISEIGTCEIYDKRNGFNIPYSNVVLKH